MGRRRAYSLDLVRLHLATQPRLSHTDLAVFLARELAPMSFDTARRYIRQARALPPIEPEAAARILAGVVAVNPAPAAPAAPAPAPAPARPPSDKVLARRATLQAWLQRNPTAAAKQVAYQFGGSITTAQKDLAAYNMPNFQVHYRRRRLVPAQ